jgi:hypothetical protein
VNVQNPFGKYVPPNPDTDRELLARQWYSRTWDAKIADPAREFLLVLELYLDKTGRTASLKSYYGEPVIMSTPLPVESSVSSGGQHMVTAGLY